MEEGKKTSEKLYITLSVILICIGAVIGVLAYRMEGAIVGAIAGAGIGAIIEKIRH